MYAQHGSRGRTTDFRRGQKLGPRDHVVELNKPKVKPDWHVELDIRNIKSTLRMEVLRCKTPDMVKKEIWVNLLAYNLIRLLMAQAAQITECSPRQLSFKHTIQLWVAWNPNLRSDYSEQQLQLFVLIGEQRVSNRSNRIEPRAVKRRPKPNAKLRCSRQEAREHIRQYGHP